MTELQTIKGQNTRQLELIEAHIKDDEKTRTVVDRHSTYFALLSLGLVPLSAHIANKLGLKP